MSTSHHEPPGGHVLALDLGCTKALVAVARLHEDETHELLARREVPTLVDAGAQAAVDRITGAMREACAEAAVALADVVALGIGAPGPLDRHAGVLNGPPQLPWGDVSLVAMLRAALGLPELPVHIDNDTKVGGIGEQRFGNGDGARNLVYFGVGTGIGGCVIIDDVVVHGASDNASELGHLVVWMGGPECGCGSRGCLEGIASGSGMERRARAAIAAGRSTRLPSEGVTGADIAREAAAGDELASELFGDAQEALAAAVASIMSALSPDVVVIGGGIAARNGRPWLDTIAARARELAFGPNAGATRIAGPALGTDSVLHGAVALAREASEASSRTWPAT